MSEHEDPFFLPSSGKDFDLQAARVIAALQGQKIRTLEEWKAEFEREVKDDYVCKNEWKPVMRLVYGMAGLMLTAVAGAIINLVVKHS